MKEITISSSTVRNRHDYKKAYLWQKLNNLLHFFLKVCFQYPVSFVDNKALQVQFQKEKNKITMYKDKYWLNNQLWLEKK